MYKGFDFQNGSKKQNTQKTNLNIQVYTVRKPLDRAAASAWFCCDQLQNDLRDSLFNLPKLIQRE